MARVSLMTVMTAVVAVMTVLAGVAKGGAREEYLEEQNNARAKVGVAPLLWDSRLENYAMSYANQRRKDCALQHSDGPYGENIFWGGAGKDWTPTEAANLWVAESKFFNFGAHWCDQEKFMQCGHYQQIVWRHTTKVGCAKVTCNNGGTFITCNYDPPGNYVGEKAY